MTLYDFTLNELLSKRGFDLAHARYVRHDHRALAAWRRGSANFDHFVSYQRDDSISPYNGAELAVQFVPQGPTGALFVGGHYILDSWAACDNPERNPSLWTPFEEDYGQDLDHRRYDLARIENIEDLVGRLIIDWGAATRSWSQWAERKPKPIVELRATAEDEAFPGFGEFTSTVQELPTLPSSWQNALASVNGVYLLVCPETGEQYVGSAYGDGGFMGRWASYAVNGHGGNKLLLVRKRTNYAISILEIASPDMSASEIINRESAWKTKLGSRAHGLNAN
ncbi:GIY-YIG nuclease family protein [Ruegeria sp. Alg231-54]|uniref:GIY-YIG nuclease family protein n=1 Tax=Ruegeria sp. Alg231-54 TaxID=1922221 RepID=UPI000D55C653|nr:GIY-YIG nuclease family protein [Ruegeria sp. Alg231-54]